ncbi:MAG: hypothetical protein L6Q71_03855 [Planctomycetes bacterium]|nr:hypothetical protein [Planctomycetota bacterium]NUQ34315.1 hypothetical protein [Planctomycetaceae bacterium]
MDAQQLSKFSQRLVLAASEHWKVIEAIPKQETSAALFLEMWKLGILSTGDIGLLAGASGCKASEANLHAGVFDPKEHCIFSGPRDGKVLLDAIAGKKPGNVVLCFNRHYYDDDRDNRNAVLFSGDTRAKLRSVDEIIEVYNEETLAKLSPPGGNVLSYDDFLKLEPLRNVAPE